MACFAFKLLSSWEGRNSAIWSTVSTRSRHIVKLFLLYLQPGFSIGSQGLNVLYKQ